VFFVHVVLGARGCTWCHAVFLLGAAKLRR